MSMIQAKPYASLSAGLLARKGAATPAMRPQHDSQGIGWNDMGDEVSPPEPFQITRSVDSLPQVGPSEPPVVHLQQDALVEAFEPAVPVAYEAPEPVAYDAPEPVAFEPPVVRQPVAAPRVAKPRAAPGSKGKSAFTLRLDGTRHLRLRLAGAHLHRSAQSIVVEALEKYLDTFEAKQARTN